MSGYNAGGAASSSRQGLGEQPRAVPPLPRGTAADPRNGRRRGSSEYMNACVAPEMLFEMDAGAGDNSASSRWDRERAPGDVTPQEDYASPRGRDTARQQAARSSSQGYFRTQPGAAPSSEPQLLHSISSNASSVLSLAVDDENELIFSGSQSENIDVWDLQTYTRRGELVGHTSSILALALAPQRQWLFSSSGDNTVRIWDTKHLKPLYVVSPADDNVGDIFALKWCEDLQTLYLGCQNTSIQWIHLHGLPYEPPSSGSTGLRLGGRNGGAAGTTASGDWQAFQVDRDQGGRASPSLGAPVHRPNKFFDSGPMRRTPSGTNPSQQSPRAPSSPALGSAPTLDPQQPAAEAEDATTCEVQYLQLSHTCQLRNAHVGYIYDLELVSLGSDKPYVLISGSGDEDIKLWELQRPSPLRPSGGISHLGTLHNSDAGILALATWQSTLFVGLQGGQVDVWDLETFTVLRTLKAGDGDVLSLGAIRGPEGRGSALFSACSDGTIKRFDARFRCISQWKGHSGVVLSLAVSVGPPVPTRQKRDVKLLSGGSDSLLKVWSCSSNGVAGSASQHMGASVNSAAHALLGVSLDSAPGTPASTGAETPILGGPTDFKALTKEQSDMLLVRALSDFVSFQSVSSEETREQCRQCAFWLKSCLTELGAEAKIIAGADKRNPLILATFRGRSNLQDMTSRARRPRKRCLFYGHYDCIGADGKWQSDPWTVTGRDGYLYGRGVSDNKGPVLAAAFAASQLLSRRELEIDLVMLIEGEEERGSVGFQQALIRAKEDIGPIDVILLSNSYWLGEDTPCLTLGLRGVVQVTVKITGRIPDVHSGVEGGAVREPMVDMVRLLSSASTGDKVLVPGFYDSVKQVSPEEREAYEAIVKMKQSRARSAEDLIARWRLPTFSIHKITVSGPGNSTVIPSTVEASISIRIVPDQSLQTITSSLVNHLITSFRELKSNNVVNVSVDHTADWWAGKPDSPFALAMSGAIEAEWGIKPVNICEGGSIPAVAILEKELGAPAVHIPSGQAGDSAHLPNERIRLLNLLKSRAVMSRFMKAIAL